MIIYWLLTSLI